MRQDKISGNSVHAVHAVNRLAVKTGPRRRLLVGGICGLVLWASGPWSSASLGALVQDKAAEAAVASDKQLPSGPVTAYVGATVRTGGPAGTLQNATLLVADGRVWQVGVDVEIPADARLVDWSGKTVLPGIVDPYYVDSSLRPGSGSSGRRVINVGGRTIEIPGDGSAAESGELLRVRDLWNPNPDQTQVAMRSGVTTLHWVTSGYGLSLFSSSHLVSEGGTIKGLEEAWGERVFTAASPNAASLEIIRRGISGQANRAGSATAAAPPAGGPGRGRRPPRLEDDESGADMSTENRSEEVVGEWASDDLTDAEFQQEGSEGASGGGSAGGAAATSPADGLWEKVRAGELPVLINANSAAAILHVLKIVKPAEKAKVLLVANATDLYQVRDALVGSRVHVIVRPRLEKVSNSAIRFNVGRELSARSIPFSFSLSANQADFQQSQDTPLFPVATLVKTGLDADRAVQALTLHPAQALGIDKWVGSLEANKQANLLVFDRDPLTDVGRLEQVHVGGKLVYENR